MKRFKEQELGEYTTSAKIAIWCGKKKAAVESKWKEANKKYPWLKPVLIGCGIAAAGGIGYAVYWKGFHHGALEVAEHHIEYIKENYPKAYDIIIADDKSQSLPAPESPSNESEATGSLKKYWEEYYNDNWNKVVECAKSLNLQTGEMFIIEDQKQLIGDPDYPNLDPEMPVVSHLINSI